MLLAGLLVLLVPLGAALATGRTRWLGLAVSLAALPAPWVTSPPWLAAMVALTVAFGAVRVYELAADRRPRGLGQRLFHAVAFIDTRRMVPAPPRLARGHLVRALAFLPPTLAGLALAHAAPPDGAARWAMRWGGGLLFAYCLTEVAYAGMWAGYRARGQILPALHRDPALSRSVGEFWGERWNLTVASLLRAHCFRPLARRGRPRLGLVAAFVASAALHAWVFLPLGPRMAGLMLAFFALQLALVLLERPLRVARWRPLAAHLWVVGALALTSPLFVEPLLRVARV